MTLLKILLDQELWLILFRTIKLVEDEHAKVDEEEVVVSKGDIKGGAEALHNKWRLLIPFLKRS